MFKCSNVQISNIQMYECSNVKMFKYSNIQMLKCSNIHMLIFSNVQIWKWSCLMFKCSNVQMFKFSNVQMFKCSNVKIFKCSSGHFFFISYSWWIWDQEEMNMTFCVSYVFLTWFKSDWNEVVPFYDETQKMLCQVQWIEWTKRAAYLYKDKVHAAL